MQDLAAATVVEQTDRGTARRLLIWLLVVLGVGIVARLVRYALQMPVWGDESRLMLNVVTRGGYAELTAPLDYGQVAPLGFLAAQYTVVKHLGISELTLRLVPLVMGVAGLLLTAGLAVKVLPARAALFAAGIVATGHYTIRYSLDIQPYAGDLACAALILLLATRWLGQPRRLAWPVALVCLTPVMLLLSYPAVFVSGGVCLAVFAELWRGRRTADRRQWALFAAYGLVLVLSFGLVLRTTAEGQYAATYKAMMNHWALGLPPANPFAFVVWFFQVHTSEMFAYPVGSKNGGSALTFICFLMGAWVLWRRRQHQLLLLLLGAFALTFIAAAMRRYPYGGSGRVAQHLVPAICLLAGLGIHEALNWCSRHRQDLLTVSITGALLVIAAGGIVRMCLRPYHERDDKTIQLALTKWAGRAGPETGVWYVGDIRRIPTQFRWYLYHGLGWDMSRIRTGFVEPSDLAARRNWWVVEYGTKSQRNRAAVEGAFQAAGGFTRTDLMQEQLEEGGAFELQWWTR